MDPFTSGFITGIITGLITGLFLSLFFYRKSLLDPIALKLAYCDSTRWRSNLRKDDPPDRDHDGMEYTEHYLNCQISLLRNAGMLASVRVLGEIMQEMAELTLNLKEGRETAGLACEEKKRHWGGRVRGLYSWRYTIRDLPKMLWQLTFGLEA